MNVQKTPIENMETMLQSEVAEQLRTHIEQGEWGVVNDMQGELPTPLILGVMHELDLPERVLFYRVLEKDRAIEVFELLDYDQQYELVTAMSDPEVIQLVESLDPDLRAHIMEELPAKVTKRLLAELSRDVRESVNVLLNYPEQSAGRIMTPQYLAVRLNDTAERALEAVRRSELAVPHLRAIFVVDENRFYRGFVPLVHLVQAQPQETMAELLEQPEVFVWVTDSELVASRVLQQFDLVSLPVLDRESRLVGIITFDDVMDVLEEEASETMYRMAGVGDLGKPQDVVYSERLTQGPIWYAVRSRIIFLLITVLGGLAVGSVIDNFEAVLQSVLVAAIFIPMVMDMGGNVGTQSTTIFARGLALGHIDMSRFLSHLAREVRTGLVMGAILGTITGTISYFWQGVPNDIPQIGIAVGISVFSVVTIATFLGFFLPWLLTKVGIDHAPGADPFLTTIKDFVGLLLYFSLVNWLIGVGG